nr:MAG TPA: hypothetical protein [Caudoviricetes sp.]
MNRMRIELIVKEMMHLSYGAMRRVMNDSPRGGVNCKR